MANTFTAKAQKYLTVLDEIYQRESLTAILEQPGAEFVGANKVRIPKIGLDGAADYNRDTGYVKGAVTVDFEEHTLQHDRGRKFRIDYVDNDEVAFELYRAVMNEYVRTKEIPEIDACRFARMAGKTNAKKVAADLTTSTDAYALFDACEEYLTDAEVNISDVVLYVSAAFYKLMKASTALSRRFDVQSGNGNVNRAVTMLDGQTPVIVVPKGRFWDLIDLKDGTTSGETGGGYAPVAAVTGPPAVTGSKAINFMAVPKPYCKAITKRNATKIIAPEVNQEADAYDVMYRCHHDLIGPSNKEKGIYVHTASTAYSGS